MDDRKMNLGEGGARDLREARRFWLKAAEQGLAGAQNRLGLMYYWGKGAVQDFTEARHLYQKAVAQGHAETQYNLGLLYANGEGGGPRLTTRKPGIYGKTPPTRETRTPATVYSPGNVS